MTPKGSGQRKRGVGDPRSFYVRPDFINGNFKKSQKNLFFFLLLLNWRGTSEVTCGLQGCLVQELFVDSLIKRLGGKGRRVQNPLSSESFGTQAATCRHLASL